MIREAIETLLDGADLTEDAAEAVMGEIMDGTAGTALVSAYLVALRAKGEAVPELVGSVRGMRNRSVRADLAGMEACDLCGTGGDGKATFNISTTAAFVAAGAGLPVAKHGNRAASSRCGSADLLEALGATVALSPREAVRCLRETGIGFFFAPAYHPAMRNVAPVRRALKLRTIFNVLGPLTNPGGVRSQLIGVFSPDLVEPLAEVLKTLGARRGAVVHGGGGFDEATTAGSNRIGFVEGGAVRFLDLDPRELGFARADAGDLKGGAAAENARITRAVLAGEKGPRRDTVLLNAALGLAVGGRAKDLPEGVAQAGAAIDTGKALHTLEAFLAFTRDRAEPLEGQGAKAGAGVLTGTREQLDN